MGFNQAFTQYSTACHDFDEYVKWNHYIGPTPHLTNIRFQQRLFIDYEASQRTCHIVVLPYMVDIPHCYHQYITLTPPIQAF
jgi:hypothetical protein